MTQPTHYNKVNVMQVIESNKHSQLAKLLTNELCFVLIKTTKRL